MVPGIQPNDSVLGFVEVGQAVYVALKTERSHIFRLDLERGQREFWKLLRPSEPAGVRNIQNVRITPNGRTVAIELYRTISNLYLATGMK